jgi:ATP-dependent exoDNAse (exonuclease V) beta subunit
LDSFFAQIARSFSLELSLPPGWQIVDEWEDDRLRSEAIATILAQDDAAQLRTLMNLLTKGEANRSVSELIRDTVRDVYDLFLETDPAAWHAVPRSRPLNETELAETLEGLRTAELTNGQMRKARDADCARALAGDWEDFLSTGLAAKVQDGTAAYYRKPIPNHVVTIYQRLLEHVRAELVGRVALQTAATYALLQKFDAAYARLKHARRGLRFADITRSLNALEHAAPMAGLTFRLDSLIEHLLLDEFQDTSPLQWRVLQPLAERVTAASGHSFFCVGDVKQAIYGWRGGVAEIFDAIDRRLADLQAQTLAKSYRSAPAVIETVNRLFLRCDQHPNLGRAEAAVGRWRRAFEEHQTARTDLPGFVEVVAAPRPAEGQSQADATLAFAAARIAELVAQAPGFSVGALVRTNQSVGQLIFELRRRGISASEEGGNPLTDAAAVLTVLSALRLSDHPGDTVARFHLAHGPLGPRLGLLDHTDDDAARRVAQAIRQTVVQHGYGPTIYGWALDLAASCSPRELSRLEQLVELAYAYESTATLRADDFVSLVAARRVSSVTPADVRVMTIHQAKGLEFDIVVLPELDGNLLGQPGSFVAERAEVTGPVTRVCRYTNANIQGLLPAPFQRMFAQTAERGVTEALCVLYVAVTRAVHALHAVIPPSAENERSVPGTFAGLLRVALRDAQPVEPAALVYQTGDRQWYQGFMAKRPASAAAVPADAAAAQPPVQVRLAPAAGARRRGWERARPSGLEGGSRVPLERVLAAERSGALVRGKLIHAWFEQIRWLDDDRPDAARLRQVADEILATAAPVPLDVAKTLAQFSAMLERPAIAELLCRSRYADVRRLGFASQDAARFGSPRLNPIVRNERGFALRQGAQLLTGFIDRLVLLQRDDRVVAAEIIDYKTDAIDVQDAQQLADKVAFYAPQLEAYRNAVARVTGLQPQAVLARLAFVEAGIVSLVR